MTGKCSIYTVLYLLQAIKEQIRNNKLNVKVVVRIYHTTYAHGKMTIIVKGYISFNNEPFKGFSHEFMLKPRDNSDCEFVVIAERFRLMHSAYGSGLSLPVETQYPQFLEITRDGVIRFVKFRGEIDEKVSETRKFSFGFNLKPNHWWYDECYSYDDDDLQSSSETLKDENLQEEDNEVAKHEFIVSSADVAGSGESLAVEDDNAKTAGLQKSLDVEEKSLEDDVEFVDQPTDNECVIALNQQNIDEITERCTTAFERSSQNIKFWGDVENKIHSTYRAAKRRQNLILQNQQVC